MGKTKKLYLAKRMLAMILAAAMSVTMIPSTALAASADDPAAENVVNDIAAEDGDTDVPADGDASVDEGEPKDSDGADQPADAKNVGQADADNGAAEKTDGTESSEAADNQADANGEDDPAPAAEKPVYEISIDGFKTEAVYDGYEPFDLSVVELKKTENGSTETVYDMVTHKWEVKGEDGNYTALSGEPVNVGEYRLTLSYQAVADVHDGAEKTVACEITKAPLTINLKPMVVKPGALKDAVKAEIDSVDVADADQGILTEDTIALQVTDVRNAIADVSLKQDEKMEKDGDYVADITPSIKADASEAAKAAARNYEIESFTADIEMGELTETRIIVTLTDQWKDSPVKRVYSGKPVDAPALTTDYTYEIQYFDEAAKEYKKLENAEAAGAWKVYEGCEVNDKGEVLAPVNAGTYAYTLSYEDKDGVYAESVSENIAVEVDPAPVTVTIANTKEIQTTAGTLMTQVLSQVTYKAEMKVSDKTSPINPKENHIWGTGYDDANVSQIYEPAFTLQVKDGQTWKSISDADYRMEGGKEYRVVYDGKKAIYNADGTYAHRTGINSGLDDNGEEINGADGNYRTDEAPSTDEQALTVTVEAGVEMEWDLEALLNDGKAGLTPEKAGAKDYDNTPLYANKSDYKNKIKLKGVTETGKTLNAVGNDFTYTWYKANTTDLLDKEILEQNKANGFSDYGFEDGNNWQRIGTTAPTDAGIYKLEVAYRDKTDDGTLYHVKDGKTAVVYYVINKVQLTISAAGEYSVLSGRTPYQFFIDKKQIEELEKNDTMKDRDGKEYKIPAAVGDLVPYWGVVAHVTDESGAVSDTWYPEDSDDHVFTTAAGTTYEIQARGVGYRYYYGEGDYKYYGSFETNENYTVYKGEKKEKEANADGKKEAYRENTLLSEKTALAVKPMGTAVLNLTPDPAKLVAYDKKTYDGESLTVKEVNPEDAYTLKTADGQDVPKDLIEYRLKDKGTDYGYVYPLEEVMNAGEYDLYACFQGNETYAPLDLGPEPVTVPGVLIGTVKIAKRQIKLELTVDDVYEAGPINTLKSDITDAYKVTGYAESDGWAFDKEDGYAWNYGPRFLVYEKGSKTPVSGNILHRNKEFEIRYDAEYSSLEEYDFARNYEVATTAEEVLCTFKTIAAPAGIASVSSGNVKKLAIATPEVKRDKDNNVSQTVNVLEGIGYATDNGMTGNLAAFTITAPAEFSGRIPDTAMYTNEVEKAGGKVISEQKYNGKFTVLFDAAAGAKSFNIRWEDKYIETIKLDFDKSQCLGNLQDAVAPKALAFNGAPKKLAIGSSVQLDVKITKAQMADVVCLGYKSSDESVMHVNPESGYVTALKKAKATITVFPQHMDENGDMVPIEGAKTATVTIEGTLVTVPKPVKVTAHGRYADLDYGVVGDGYRREIYVAAGKQTAQTIEANVKKLQGNKNQWRNDFVIAPVYQDSADESYNRAYRDYTARLSGLASDTQYTVYVRNVCEAKTLSDGNVITQSTVDASAAGTAVSFKTLKSEATALDLKLDETVEGITDVTDYSSMTVPAFYSDTRTYRVDFAKLAKKGLESKALGRFFLNASDPAADSSDYLDLELPIKDAQYKGVYQEPKLQYYVWTVDKNGNSVKAQKNDFVSIDKKGKIKLTGVTDGYYDWEENSYSGGVYIYVYDSSLKKSASIQLIIDADVDSVAAKKKNVSLSVGQSVNLNDISLYTYKAGKTKLTSYQYPDMDMDAVRKAVKAQEEYFALDGNSLRAIKGGGKLELALTDKEVKRYADPESNATAKITFVSKDLAPVKKIKGFDVTNDKFGLTFTHAGEAAAFRVEILDSSSKKLLDKRYERSTSGGVFELWTVSGNRRTRVKDGYYIKANRIRSDVQSNGGRLAKESQYTVRITALYDGVSAKPATGKVKTTKIPAVGTYLEDSYTYNSDGYITSVTKPRGGMEIEVSEGNYELSYDPNNGKYNSSLRVLSGNSYTLTAKPSNRGRVSDTLVWTIGDKKVASVKAAAGTYCITLKGLKPGSTTLEVKSKILGNKVIARYGISVVAVGDAYKDGGRIRYRGDDEQENYYAPGSPEGTGNNAPDYLALSVDDPRKVRASQYNQFSFTAPEDAKYTFKTTGNLSLEKKTSKNGNWSYSGTDLGWLTKGRTIYLKSNVTGSTVNSAYYVEINPTQRMETASDGQTVTGQQREEYFVFTAPKAGQYQFSLNYGNNSKTNLYLYTNADDVMNGGSSSSYGKTVECAMEEGESVWLKTSYLNWGTEYTLHAEKISEDVVFGTPKQVTLASGATTYLMYTIEKSGRYQFSAAADTVSYNVSGEIKVGSEVKASINDNNFSEKLELNQGDVVCVKVTNNGSADVTFTVNTQDITPKDLSAAAGTVPNGSDTLYMYTAPAVGAYQFTMTVDQAGASDAGLKIWNSASDAENYYKSPLATGIAGEAGADGKVTITASVVLGAGQTVYVNPVNNSGSDLTAALGAAKDTGVLEITASGTNVALEAGQDTKAIFVAGETAIYTFTSADTLGAYTTFELSRGGSTTETITVYSGDALSKKVVLKSGQVVMWTMTASDAVEFKLCAELTDTLGELKLGQTAQVSVLGEDDAPGGQATAEGHIFTVPEDGYYTFWSEGSKDTYGILYDLGSVDAETCLLHNNMNGTGSIDRKDGGGPMDEGHNFGIYCNLTKGQTVYLKSMCYDSSESASFTVHVGKGSQPWNN